ncbi:MAG: response regulator [Anaerolineae bacterium]|nr:response regulator [Anaerolineae bacterium]
MDSEYEILIVDDNPANLRLLSQLLTKHNYKVRAVLNGSQALTILDANPPDLILLDLMMPGIDGYEVCERVKAHPDGKNIPIIFISALGGVQDKVRAFQAGGADYITKPFQVEEIIARVETHLTLQKMQKQHNRDISELTARLGELDKEMQALEQKNEELSVYDQSVAHEMKKPLSFICTTTEWLQNSYNQLTTEQLTHFLGQITARAYQASNIIESLLVLAQTDAIDVYPIDMYSTAQRSVEHLQELITERKARLIFPDSLPQAMGHTTLVTQVWENYLSNAIKYGGNPPHIRIGANQQDSHTVRYWVIDNGPGITGERKTNIFTSQGRSSDGTVESYGLGLAIARRIIHRLGGQVGFENLPQNGCCFYFTLPTVQDN